MALRARHRWVAERVAETFELSREEAEDFCRANIGDLNVFIRGERTKMFVYHQQPLVCKEDGEWVPVADTPTLQLTDGLSVPLRGRGMFFLRPTGDTKPLDENKDGDGGVMVGQIGDDPLAMLEHQVTSVYSRALEARTDWGRAKKEETSEFMAEMGRFADGIDEAMKGRDLRIKLESPDPVKHDFDALLAAASTVTAAPVGAPLRPVVRTETDEFDDGSERIVARAPRAPRGLPIDPDVVREFMGIVGTWIDKISKHLEETESSTVKPDDGPRAILEWWKARRQKLTSVTEQLRTSGCATVVAVLSAVLKAPASDKYPEDLPDCMRQWKDVNMAVTEAANEAKDNVNYLSTLERFVEPLYSGTPVTIIDSLPALLNSIRMVNAIARYFNTRERMTDLFARITSEMIVNCRKWVLSTEPETESKLWNKDREALVGRFRDCMELNRAYQETYRTIKERLATTPRAKQFDFSEQAIFSRFDLFCRRSAKLAHMFATVHQFETLAAHELEGMDEVNKEFRAEVYTMSHKAYDFLKYTDNDFDRDFVAFNVHINEIEAKLQQFINTSFEAQKHIEPSLALLRKFRAILTRPALAADLDDKLHVIFQRYGSELERVQHIYDDNKHDPPRPRNLPPVAGNITWARHLFKRIEAPMRTFESHQAVLASRDAKRIVRLYNRVARGLVAFEYLWHKAWVESIPGAKAGLQATLIIRHPVDGRLYVNFDPEILQLIREAKCLSRMGLPVPESARMVLIQEDKFKAYFNDLSHILREYARVTSKIIPVTRALLQPALEDLEYRLRPGMVTLTWTSMNIDTYKNHVHQGLRRLEELVSNINDIIENRIEHNLTLVSKTILVDLPAEESFKLDEFVDLQERHTRAKAEFLLAKNVEVESAVQDMLGIIEAFAIDPHIAPVAPEDLVKMRRHYNKYMYHALLNCAKSSLNTLKKRVAARMTGHAFFLHRPFFEVDVKIIGGAVRLVPDVDRVQGAINKVAVAVLSCMKKVAEWEALVGPGTGRTFFDRITQDMDIVRVVLLLTGSVQGARSEVAINLKRFESYEWLWKKDADSEYEEFQRENPDVDDYDRRLQSFLELEEEVEAIAPVETIGALLLRTAPIKAQLKTDVRRWMRRYNENLHKLARSRMNVFMEYVNSTTTQLGPPPRGREVDSLNSLAYVMQLLREVRHRQSGIYGEIEPILDMYTMLERYGANITKEEQDQRTVIFFNWKKLVGFAEKKTEEIATLQVGFRSQLLRDVKTFKQDVAQFREEFEASGPMEEGISPVEAMQRLKRAEDEYDMRDRKRELYQNGERLFNMPVTEYEALTRTKKELGLLGRLYGLYRDVMARFEEWSTILWSKVVANIDEMTAEMELFASKCAKLPGKLRGWQAYLDLKGKIEDFMLVLPLLRALSSPVIRPRHWDAIIELTKHDMDWSNHEFRLSELLAAPLVEFADEITEITDGAIKEDKMETDLNEVFSKWEAREFNFQPWKARGVDILIGEKGVMEELDEAQMQLQTWMTSRHIKPFKEDAERWLHELSNSSDTLSLWAKVQQTWCSLESVFLGGDIAKQMPMVAKKFQKVDKEFVNIMAKAKDDKIVVKACANEVLLSLLPQMNEELQVCQNKLQKYLEQKRSKFPRFYFVSDPLLLQILSKGSDLAAIQQYYQNVFAAVNRVQYDPKDPTQITTIESAFKGGWETVTLHQAAKASGNIEDWLSDFLITMKQTLKLKCEDMAAAIYTMGDTSALEGFVDANIAQYSLLGVQFMWTRDFTEALEKIRTERSKGPMREAVAKHKELTRMMSSWCLMPMLTPSGKPDKMRRTKIETIITIQVHQKDVGDYLGSLAKTNRIRSADDFEWLKQARFYWEVDEADEVSEEGRVRISVTDVDFNYQYEYLGTKERLVITPLTDRCYISLAQAMGMCMGGAPAGPAGTGKTETVKDMGNTLGIFVIVTNCSDQMRYTDCAKIFKGLCQSGLWGCFDEFNRITLPVLSVVAQQVQSINDAKRAQVSEFEFLGEPGVKLNPVCAYFITMNPGYAGRQELPENLKALFRSVAMMVPDREIIIKVKLCSVGYEDFSNLSVKFYICYTLCEQQLSKQKHYDFGLRNILSVLRTAGATKRNNPGKPEEELLYQTLRDMNLSKMVAQDVPLFESMLSDLFPKISNPAKQSFPEVEEQIPGVLEKLGLTPHPDFVLKILQLYATSVVRHGIMLTGPTGGGKTKISSCLRDVLSVVNGMPFKEARLNPKAVAASELYGHPDPRSGEWVKGVFAALWERYNNNSLSYVTWIMEDGPVDAIWIEDLNTVLDDNRILTLSNGDRFPMTDNTKIMFENETLKNASPATVSRAGIIYVSETDLDWKPVVDAWVKGKSEALAAILPGIWHKLLGDCSPENPGHLFRFLYREVEQVMLLSRVGAVTGTMKMIDSLFPTYEEQLGAPNADPMSEYASKVERLVLFCVVWGIGGLLETEDRTKFDNYMRGISREMPPASGDDGTTVFEMRLDPASLNWTPWRPPTWEYPSEQDPLQFSTLLVPTMDTTRSIFLVDTLQRVNYPILMVGGPGTAKTSTALMYFEHFDPAKRILKRINFSSVTTPRMLQDSVEGSLDKRGGRAFGPPNNLAMTVFIDDISMPEINLWGDQPTNEMTRQLIEMEGLYFLDKDKRGDFKDFKDLTYMAAMVHPGGGRNDIPWRLKRQFFVFNLVLPAIGSINDLYGQMLEGRFGESDLSDACREGVLDKLTKGTIELWNIMKTKMLPTPAKFHYIFNMRDLSRVFQGILLTPMDTILKGGLQTPSDNDALTLLQLWQHECARVFEDKLTNNVDKERYQKSMQEVTLSVFGEELAEAAKEEQFYVDFFRDDVYDEDEVLESLAPKIYEAGGTLQNVRERVTTFMETHNKENPATPLNLVLFEDALRHLIRISRIIQMPGGNALLVGVGGSGKQSLTRLAAYIGRHYTFQITLTKGYGVADLLEDLRFVYEIAGHQRKPVTFLLTDAEIKSEDFLEYINSILMTGEVAGLFPKDEMMGMTADLQPTFAKERPGLVETQDNLQRYFFELARDNLHIILCMSPVNRKFPERARKFPGLISSTVIDWFLPWPKEALISVSEGLLKPFAVECSPAEKEALIEHVGLVHNVVMEVCETYYTSMRRRVYQTPKSFLSFIKNYMAFYTKKLEEVSTQETRVGRGLDKLIQGAKDVEKLKGEIVIENKKVTAATVEVEKLLGVLQVDQAEAEKKKQEVQKIAEGCQSEADRIAGEKAACEEDLAKAQPIVDAAVAAVSKIKGDDITFIKAMKKPSDIIRLVMDGVLLLLFRPIDSVSPCTVNISKADWDFITPSWASTLSLLADSSFLSKVMQFDPDKVNEETVELISAYVDLPYFSPEVAGKAANAAEGLATWVAAMKAYFYASKIVKPKLEAVALAEAELDVAQRNLAAAQAEEAAVMARLAKLQQSYDEAMDSKEEKEKMRDELQAKMEQAEALINGLSGEKERWTLDKEEFSKTKRRLVGDVAVACAFLSYCGPFNSTFRDLLINKKFVADLARRSVPVTAGINIINFLTNPSEIGDWNLCSLPTDPLSVQNGILVTRSERFPLLIDPQGQAITWILNKERSAEALPGGTPGRDEVTALSSPRLKEDLVFCMSDGKAFVVVGVEEELDPLLDPILEKQIIQKSKTRAVVKLGDDECDLDKNFRMYFLTRLPNPHFSPELQAKTTVIDFTVTMKGLEDQLLGIVIKREQRALEEQLEQVLAEVNANRKSLLDLDNSLLAKLSAGGGNLLEEVGLVEMLAETKAKAAEVSEKLQRAEETQASIAEQREQYRPVATRGSVLYFSIVDMSLVNVMYQTSLVQFVNIFQQSITDAPKSKLTNKRVDNVISTMTYLAYRYVNKGLYEQHKLLYVFLLTLKILVRASTLEQSDVSLFLRGGAALDASSARAKPKWIINLDIWLNVLALSDQVPVFRALPDNITRSEPQWREWYESNEPEVTPIPDFDLPLRENKETGPWLRLLLVRSLRPDRTLLAVRNFIREVAEMGPEYVEPVTDTVDEIYDTMDAATPVIYLLSTGADPTEAIQQLAKRRKNHVSCISMGEGQEERAKKDIEAAAVGGSWCLLQNCELGLELMFKMEDKLKGMAKSSHPDFRLFITALPHPEFPLGLLQMCTKVTNEPPNGLRAGLMRSYNVIVDQDRLERIDTPSQAPMWRRLLFALCFLHSIVQERRKFGPLGWNIPYEFNSGDLSATIQFLEGHLYAGALSWPTLRYICGRVAYGGKVTDDMDTRLFIAYTAAWVSPRVLEDGFSFAPEKCIQPIPGDFSYALLDATDVAEYREYASSFPDIDSPEVFGLHPNADLTFRTKEVGELLATLGETQPRASGGGGKGKSMDDVVTEKAEQLLSDMPSDYVEDIYLDQLRALGGLSKPMNIFLMQEIQRFQAVIALVRAQLRSVCLAIRGDVVMTTELQDAMTSIFDANVPSSWLTTPGGDEFSWLFPTLSSWFASLQLREKQFRGWIEGDVPMSFWLTGFSNPQGFLTAMKQTETRKHRRDGWALDATTYWTDVTTMAGPDSVRERPDSGVYCHGLFVDGARWVNAKSGGSLVESEPKKPSSDLPVLHISCVLNDDKNTGEEKRRYAPNGPYECPLYRYARRTDLYIICMVRLHSRHHNPEHWVLRGVALLCVT